MNDVSPPKEPLLVEINEDTRFPARVVVSIGALIVMVVVWGVRVESKIESLALKNQDQDQKMMTVEVKQEQYMRDVDAIRTTLTEIRTELKYMKPNRNRD